MINIHPSHLKIVRNILDNYVSEYEVRIFGSRITDSVKKYSDLDLVIKGKKRIADNVLYVLKEAFQESDLPFRVDILDWNGISEEFKTVIEQKYEIIQKFKK